MALTNTLQALTPAIAQRRTQECCLCNVISMPQLQHLPNLSSIPLPTSLFEPSRSHGALCSSNQLPKLCTFLAIARELRDMVYSDLITSENVAILRVCQQVHDEAKDVLCQQGICRLSLFYGGYSSYLEALSTPSTSSNRIPNYDITIDLEPYPYTYFSRSLERHPRFYILDPGCGECHMILASIKFDFDILRVPTPVFRFVETLTSFKVITLRIYYSNTFHPKDRRNHGIVAPLHTRNLQSVAIALSTALGHPEWKSESGWSFREKATHAKANPHKSPYPGAQYLVFHPRRELEAITGIDR